jgi:hypothetical protein
MAVKLNSNYILHVGDGSTPAKHLIRWLAGYYVDVDVEEYKRTKNE